MKYIEKQTLTRTLLVIDIDPLLWYYCVVVLNGVFIIDANISLDNQGCASFYTPNTNAMRVQLNAYLIKSVTKERRCQYSRCQLSLTKMTNYSSKKF